MKVAVVGGGIAGLSAAYYLDKQARAVGHDAKIILLESANYWGGKIKTVVEDGFVVEGGPDAYLVSKPWMRALACEVGLENDLQGTNPNFSATFILHNGILTPLPAKLTMTIPTEISPIFKTKLLTWPQKMRMGLDLFLPANKQKGDESLAEFISRRLGRAAYERLVGPLLSGIYAGDGNRLSLQSTFPNLRQMELEHGSLIKGALSLRVNRVTKAGHLAKNGNYNGSLRQASIFESPRSGLTSIVNRIVARLEETGVDLRLKTSVGKVVVSKSGCILTLTTSEEIRVDAVVLATPAYVAGDLMKDALPNLADELNSIEYVSTATVSLAYLKDELPTNLEGYGYIVPQQEGSKALACTWTSSKWRHRAPDNRVLLRVFIGRIQDVNTLPTDKDLLISMAREELRYSMGIKTQPIAAWAFYWEKAMPQYNLGHPERLERIERLLMEHPNLVLAGNGYRGIGIPDCVHSGMEAAEKIVEFLKRTKE